MATEGTGDDVNVKFGASIDDLKAKLGEVGNIFGELTKRFAAMAAVVAGGAAFKAFIEEANQANVAAEKMARTLGITTDEAGILAVAIDDIAEKMGVEAGPETYTQAFLKFNRALKSSSDEMKALGVDVDALKSGQKTSNEVFQEALQIVGTYEAGVDQTQVAMKLFGRSIQDVQVLMQLNAEALADARKAAEELNLTITAEGVKAAEDYRVAMDNVGDVMQGLRKTIGEGVMPIFTALAQKLASIGPVLVEGMKAAVDTFVAVWNTLAETVTAVWDVISTVLEAMKTLWQAVFGTDGPDAMEIFKNALRLVQVAFIGFRIGVELVVEVVQTGLVLLGQTLTSWADIAVRALSLDFSGAKAAWEAGVAEREAILAASADRLIAIAERGATDIDKALTGSGAAARTPGGKTGSGGTKKAPDIDAAADAARLALMKTKQEAELALEQEYLRQAMAIYQDAYAQNLIDTRGFYEAKQAIELRGLDATIDVKRREAQAAAKQAATAVKAPDRLKFQAEEQKLLGEINVLEAKRNDTVRANAAAYEAAERDRMDALNTIRANRTNAAVESDISIERGAIEQMRALRQIDADEALAMQASLEARSYAATQAALAQKQQLVRGDAVKQAQLDAEAEAAERQHQGRLIVIDRQASLQKRDFLIKAQQGAQSAFETMLNDLMDGTMKLGDVMRNFALNLATTFQHLIAQKFAEKVFDVGGDKLMEWIVTPVQNALSSVVAAWFGAEEAKTAATEVGTAVRVTAEEGAASESLLLTAATAVKRIAIAAWEAAASVYASIAAIPYVGPFLAPAMAVAAGAAVLGFASHIASAEGGWWQVPSDQVAQIHKDEMVMPAAEAQGIREMIGGGGRGGGGPTNINITAVDAKSVQRLFNEHGPALVKSLQNQGRNFNSR